MKKIILIVFAFFIGTQAIADEVFYLHCKQTQPSRGAVAITSYLFPESLQSDFKKTNLLDVTLELFGRPAVQLWDTVKYEWIGYSFMMNYINTDEISYRLANVKDDYSKDSDGEPSASHYWQDEFLISRLDGTFVFNAKQYNARATHQGEAGHTVKLGGPTDYLTIEGVCEKINAPTPPARKF